MQGEIVSREYSNELTHTYRGMTHKWHTDKPHVPSYIYFIRKRLNLRNIRYSSIPLAHIVHIQLFIYEYMALFATYFADERIFFIYLNILFFPFFSPTITHILTIVYIISLTLLHFQLKTIFGFSTFEVLSHRIISFV